MLLGPISSAAQNREALGIYDCGMDDDLPDLPGFEIFDQGMADLESGRDTPEAAALRMASRRLTGLGLDVPAEEGPVPASHHLYELLAATDPRTAHGRFNAIAARLSSFINAVEHARAS